MKNQNRTLIVIFATVMLLASQRAMAAAVEGAYALDLASVIAAHSPVLSRAEKGVMAQLFDGHSSGTFAANRTISIRVDAVDCKEGEVDITSRICSLTFGAKNIFLTRRAAHELYATLAEVGITSEGAAGSSEVSLSNLMCTIKPHVIAQNAGGGADCSFHPSP